MDVRCLRRLIGLSFCCLVFSSLFSSRVMAQQGSDSEGYGQEAPASQAQATLASLFGRGAKMPSVPHPKGTIALPSFDNSRMTIDEGSLPGIQKQKK
ncbi:MAG: hypothetical protein V1882_11945 [Candidatus Omnitrophota bacterium]